MEPTTERVKYSPEWARDFVARGRAKQRSREAPVPKACPRCGDVHFLPGSLCDVCRDKPWRSRG